MDTKNLRVEFKNGSSIEIINEGSETPMIWGFDGRNSFLSNFYHSPISEGLGMYRYPTVEHYYQCMKAATREDHDIILLCQSPGQAKRMGRNIQIRPDFEDEKVEIMLKGLRMKFAPGTHMAANLIATKDQILVEANSWYDTFWGVCNRRRKGQNVLGELLMLVRKELQLVTMRKEYQEWFKGNSYDL